MHQGKYLWVVVCAALLSMAATACSAKPEPHDGVVTADWGAPQNQFIPGDTVEANGIKVVDSIFTGLLSYDPRTSAPVYENAAAITTSDQEHFTVTIKPGWIFSDGSPVTASSYVDAWNYTALATDKQLNSGYFQYIQGYGAVNPTKGAPAAATMSGLRVVNATTFTVALDQKFSDWPQTLGHFVFAPLPASFFKNPAAWAKHPVGDGPYRVASYVPGQVLKLRPFPGYRGTQKPQNQGVDLKVYTDPAPAYADLVSGRLDIDDTLPLTELPNASRDLDGRLVNTPSGALSHLAFPLYGKEWGTPAAAKVREGISMAINRPLIADKILHGTVTPATDWTAPVLGSAGGYQAGLCGTTCGYDPVRAKQLIDGAGGIPGGSMTITYNADGGNKPWVDAVCSSIDNALGDDRACLGKPVATFAQFSNLVSGHEMTSAFRSSWDMDYPLAQDFLQPVFATRGANNDSGYSNPLFDSLINQANAAPDPAAANSLYQQAERQLVTDMPSIPLWYQNSVAGYSAGVSHVEMDGFREPVYYAIRK